MSGTSPAQHLWRRHWRSEGIMHKHVVTFMYMYTCVTILFMQLTYTILHGTTFTREIWYQENSWQFYTCIFSMRKYVMLSMSRCTVHIFYDMWEPHIPKAGSYMVFVHVGPSIG